MKVFSNLAISLDGRIADSQNPTAPLGTPWDRKVMQTIRALSDVIVVGASTLRVNPESIRIRGPLGKKRKSQVANAVVTASGDLDAQWPFWQDSQVIRFVFTTNRGLEKARRAAEDRAFVVSCGEERVSIESLLRRLKESDYRKVLVEGGGRLIGEFLSENFLQEMYVTHTPWIIGGPRNPSLVQNPLAFDEWKKLRPLKIKRVKNEIYAHYQVRGARHV